MSDVFGGPITANGVTLQRLTMRELDQVKGIITDGIRAHVEKLIPPKTSPVERVDILRVSVPPFVGYELLRNYLITPEGAERVLKMSWEKSGRPAEEFEAFFLSMPINDFIRLALRVTLGDQPDTVG